MMQRIKIFSIPVLLLCIALSANAHDQERLFNEVQLYATVERDIPNEELKVFLVAEHQGSDPSEIARRVNRDMDWALGKARNSENIETRTMSYHTSPIYRDRNITGWRASQELELTSQSVEELTELVGELQEKLQVRQMTFSPTSETRDRYEKELIGLAMEEFKNKVEVVGRHMTNMDYRIIRLDINTSDQNMPRVAYAERAVMSMDAAMAPAVEAGTSKISVTVNGSVQFY